jgi:hypothetical protein
VPDQSDAARAGGQGGGSDVSPSSRSFCVREAHGERLTVMF